MFLLLSECPISQSENKTVSRDQANHETSDETYPTVWNVHKAHEKQAKECIPNKDSLGQREW